MRPDLNNILIIDDNKNDLEIAQHYLNKAFEGLMFVTAQSGKDFDEKISWVRPDLIISDFDLPDCTGLDLLIKVRSTDDIPFIFMSGTLQDHDDKLSQSILKGANGYILKDKMKNLPSIVNQVLENEYVKRSAITKRNENFALVKLQMQKCIADIDRGVDAEKVHADLKEVYQNLLKLD